MHKIPTVRGGERKGPHLELSETGEDSELHLLELEEGMVECLCGSQSLPWVSHQELTDLGGETKYTQWTIRY